MRSFGFSSRLSADYARATAMRSPPEIIDTHIMPAEGHVGVHDGKHMAVHFTVRAWDPRASVDHGYWPKTPKERAETKAQVKAKKLADRAYNRKVCRIQQDKERRIAAALARVQGEVK